MNEEKKLLLKVIAKSLLVILLVIGLIKIVFM